MKNPQKETARRMARKLRTRKGTRAIESANAKGSPMMKRSAIWGD